MGKHRECGCMCHECVARTQRPKHRNQGFSQPSLLTYARRFSQGQHPSASWIPDTHASRFSSPSQTKGHSAFSPSTPSRNVALPLIFAVFSQRGQSPQNINLVLLPHRAGMFKGRWITASLAATSKAQELGQRAGSFRGN